MDDPRSRGPSAHQEDELATALLGSTLRAAQALRLESQGAMPEVRVALEDVDGAPATLDGFWDVAMSRAVDRAKTVPGLLIELGPRVYRFAAPIVIDVPVGIRGVGARREHLFAEDDAQPTTVLHFVNGTSGLLFQRSDSDEASSASSCLEGVVVRGAWSRNLPDVPAARRRSGIDVRSSNATVRDVRVELFSGDAVRISGAPHRSPDARADAWLLEGCSLVRCGGDGLSVRQGLHDNEGFALRVHAVGNRGRGFVDESRVGNLYVACHASANGRSGFVRVTPPPVEGETVVGCPVYLACFSEGSEERPDGLGSPSLVLGGNLSAARREVPSSAPPADESALESSAVFDSGEAPTGTRVRSWVASDGRSLDLSGLETLLQFLPAEPTSGVHERAPSTEPSTPEVPPESRSTSLEGRRRHAFVDEPTVGRPEWVGRAGDRVFIEMGRDIPDESAFERPVGSRVYHPAPIEGGFEGWVKVETGPGPRTWRTFGRIAR